jgi:hypothetical protein
MTGVQYGVTFLSTNHLILERKPAEVRIDRACMHEMTEFTNIKGKGFSFSKKFNLWETSNLWELSRCLVCVSIINNRCKINGCTNFVFEISFNSNNTKKTLII